MKKILLFGLGLFIFLGVAKGVKAQEEVQFYKAEVIKIEEEGKQAGEFGEETEYQWLRLKGEDLGDKTIKHFSDFGWKKLKKGEKVVVVKMGEEWRIIDRYRLDWVVNIAIGLVVFVIVVAGWRGFSSLLGMGLSLAVIVLFIVPRIVNGESPLQVTIIGSGAILLLTIFLSHGINKKISVAVMSTFLCLILAGVLSTLFVKLTGIDGLGSEEAFSLSLGFGKKINFEGLYLASVIIGTLGILDDVTVAQSSTIFEIAEVNKKLGRWELFTRGMRVGKEHVASMINTLILAYAGSGLVLFLLFYINRNSQPLWVVLNSGLVVEEIVRSLAGSLAIVMAVPLTTMMAAGVFGKRR
jgi:uncharacterized membrane protein